MNVTTTQKWPEAKSITALGKHPSAGEEVHAERFTSASGIVEVPTNGLSTGLYVAVLYGDGTRLGSSKFELTR